MHLKVFKWGKYDDVLLKLCSLYMSQSLFFNISRSENCPKHFRSKLFEFLQRIEEMDQASTLAIASKFRQWDSKVFGVKLRRQEPENAYLKSRREELENDAQFWR